MIYSIILGDWSGDGHRIKDPYYIKTDNSMNELLKAYNNSVNKTGVDFLETVCAEYQDTEVSKDVITKMGLDVKNYKLDEVEDDVYEMTSEVYIQMLSDFIHLHNPNISFEFINHDIPMVFSGGYGLYDNY